MKSPFSLRYYAQRVPPTGQRQANLPEDGAESQGFRPLGEPFYAQGRDVAVPLRFS